MVKTIEVYFLKVLEGGSWDQGGTKLGLSWGLCPWLAGGKAFHRVLTWPFLWARVDSERVCSGVSSSSHEDFSQMGLGSPSNGLIYFIGSLKILSPNTFWSPGCSTYEFWGGHMPAHKNKNVSESSWVPQGFLLNIQKYFNIFKTGTAVLVSSDWLLTTDMDSVSISKTCSEKSWRFGGTPSGTFKVEVWG